MAPGYEWVLDVWRRVFVCVNRLRICRSPDEHKVATEDDRIDVIRASWRIVSVFLSFFFLNELRRNGLPKKKKPTYLSRTIVFRLESWRTTLCISDLSGARSRSCWPNGDVTARRTSRTALTWTRVTLTLPRTTDLLRHSLKHKTWRMIASPWTNKEPKRTRNPSCRLLMSVRVLLLLFVPPKRKARCSVHLHWCSLMSMSMFSHPPGP